MSSVPGIRCAPALAPTPITNEDIARAAAPFDHPAAQAALASASFVARELRARMPRISDAALLAMVYPARSHVIADTARVARLERF